MSLGKNILELIEAEQMISDGKLVPSDPLYFKKLEEKAELITHESNGKCLGFVFFYCNDPNKTFSYISLVAVSPSARSKGIATSLIKYVFSVSRIRGLRACRLEVRKDNQAALALYLKLGFHCIEDRDEKYLMEISLGL